MNERVIIRNKSLKKGLQILLLTTGKEWGKWFDKAVLDYLRSADNEPKSPFEVVFVVRPKISFQVNNSLWENQKRIVLYGARIKDKGCIPRKPSAHLRLSWSVVDYGEILKRTYVMSKNVVMIPRRGTESHLRWRITYVKVVKNMKTV